MPNLNTKYVCNPAVEINAKRMSVTESGLVSSLLIAAPPKNAIQSVLKNSPNPVFTLVSTHFRVSINASF